MKTSTTRVEQMRARNKAKGRTRREYYATAGEHEKIKALIKEMRE